MKTSAFYKPAIAVLLLTSLLNGCKISKDTKIPDTGLPATFRGSDSQPDSTSVANIPWQTFFSDSGLRLLISQALAHNNDLAVAVKNIEAADLYLRKAKTGNIPTASLGVSVSTQRPSDNSLNALSLNEALHTKHIEDYNIAATLSWEADIWGKISSQKAGALADYLNSVEARRAIQTRLIGDVSGAYYNLLMLDEQLRISKQNLLLNDSTLRFVRLQYDAGQVTQLAVQQAEAQRLAAARLVPQFEQEIIVQENAISVLCGTLPDSVKRSASLNAIELAEDKRTGAPVGLLRRRPDVNAAEFALDKANADVGYAKANMYPSLVITAQGGLDAFKASNWFNIPASLFGAVAGGITQPLFDHRRLKTDYKVAAVRRDQRVTEFRQTVLVAVQDVSDALVKMNKLADQEHFETQRAATLKTATHNSQLLFNNGEATYLEVITVEGDLLKSQLDLASLRKDRLQAAIDLYRSLGGGAN